MPSQTVSYVKAHLAEVLDTVRETHEPVIITQNGEAAAVVQDVEGYERSRKALAMLKLMAMGEDDVKSGRVMEQDAVFGALARRFPGPAKAGKRR